jgi:acetylornithine/N-succinyldiaminopimelate aminotransferase
LVPGDHGTTYGGNPFACAAVSKVFDIYESENIVEKVKQVSVYLMNKLDSLVDKFDCVVTRRGKGLMQGLVLDIPANDLVLKAMEHGLIVITAGTNVIRMVPPLIITKEHVDEMMEKLEKSLADLHQ